MKKEIKIWRSVLTVAADKEGFWVEAYFLFRDGGGSVQHKDCSAKELYQKASEKYEIFHIVMKAGAYQYQKSGEAWKELIGNRAVERQGSGG